jgi:transposase
MATNIKRMDQIKAIIKEYIASQSYKATARRMKVARNTVKGYIGKCIDSNIDLQSILSLNDEQLKKIFYSTASELEMSRQEIFISKIDYWIKELRKTGVTRQILWQEYRDDYPEGFGYSQFCDRTRQHIQRKDLTISMTHNPGEKVMVDFAGSRFPWYDSYTGELCFAEVLVAVLPHSQYTFAIVLPSQKIEQFVHGLNKTLEYFGGVPEVLLSDNLKSYVSKADRYEPTFTQLCVQLASHYKLTLQATRVARPKDKGSVENMVSTIYNRLYGPLRNKVFYSIGQINEAFIEQLHIHNTTAYQKKEGCRQSIFDTYELPLLRPLPADAFEIKKTTIAKVQNNYHIFLGETKNYYSVHYKYVGKKVEVVYTSRVVEIYYQGQRIALHNRINTHSQYTYSSKEEHKPTNHQIYDKIKQYDDHHFTEQAEKIGKSTHWAIDHILTYKPNKEQAYRSCLGILKLSKTYGCDRIERACKRCKSVNTVNYKMIQNILKRKLDLQDIEIVSTEIVNHSNIRGSQAYD